MDWSFEVVVLPVGDVDRSITFYRDQVGFHLDHDTRKEQMHLVQLTPPGSGCSIVFGDLPSQNQMQPGSMKARLSSSSSLTQPWPTGSSRSAGSRSAI
jgi:catechol 2,3-dioxygenase-like lactoylglutathione lyase family enzyme